MCYTKWSLESIKEFIKQNSDCKLLNDNIIDSNSKLRLLCICGDEFETTMQLFKVKAYRVCNKCSFRLRDKKERIANEEKFTTYLMYKRNKEYVLLSSYKSNKDKVLLFHTKCKKSWLVKPNNVMSSKQDCPHCNPVNNIKYTQEEIVEIVYNQVGDEYSILGKYEGVKKKILMRHNICGHEWEVTLGHFFYSNSRCPICASSKGEQIIRGFLIDNKIDFLEEYTFDGCRDIGLLRFDFAIFDKGKPNLKLLLEYDGEQHYEGWRGKGESLSIIQRRDNIKNGYCKKNNIKLIRIPYWDFSNLEEILQKELTEVICDAG